MIKFLQSQYDFPCFVELGKKSPSWGIKRWKGNNSLNFVPIDDEGFSLRGDKQRFLYKGRKRSHRFTILNDGAFEYDCILLKEPESNVITLRMEGAENYDFFRQPDFVSDDFLKSSYAVYLKETLLDQGTGKLCHIHRPLIIDARGCKCWGDLSVIGNELRITIPEQWLSEAKYPVTVDPIVGTNTLGSLGDQNDYNNYMYGRPCLVDQIGLSRYLITEKSTGSFKAWYYHHWVNSTNYAKPCMYTDVNNLPNTKKSINEKDCEHFNIDNKNPPRWVSGSFDVTDNLIAGSYIWFGIRGRQFSTYYDFVDNNLKVRSSGFSTALPDVITSINATWNIRFSWYFEYEAAPPSQDYVRTLTQGVDLTDIRKIKADYERLNTQTIKTTDIRYLKANYKRDTFHNANVITAENPLLSFSRNCVMTVGNLTGISRLPVFNRFINNEIKLLTTLKNKRDINRKCDDIVCNSDVTERIKGFIGKIFDNIIGTDYISNPVLFIRTVEDEQSPTDIFGQAKDYIRFLYDKAGNIVKMERQGEFYRIENDNISTFDLTFRHFFIFIKILTTSLVRDFILRRFLIAREELVLKSCITREIKLESKIN